MNSTGKPTPTDAARPAWRADTWRLAGFAVAYLAAHKLAYLIPEASGVIAAVWPASGLTLAVLLLSPKRLWPAILAVASTVNLVVELMAGRSLVVELGFILANLIESGASAWIICRWSGRPVTFTRVTEVLGLLFAALVVNGVSALVGATAASLDNGSSFLVLHRTWWIGDGLGMLLVAPLLVAWFRNGEAPASAVSWGRVAETMAVVVSALALAWAYFGASRDEFATPPHSYMLVAPLVWAALRLGLRGTTTTLALLAIMEVAVTALGVGSFPLGGQTTAERTLAVQLFVGAKCIIALLLAASFAERQAIERSLRANETRLRALSDNLPDSMVYQLVREPDGTRRFVHMSAGVGRLHGVSAEAVLRDASVLHDQVVAEDRAALTAAEEISRRDLSVFNVVTRMRRADGTIRWVRICSQPRRMPDGRVVWDGIETDITAQRQIEDAVRASEEKFAKAFRSSPVAVAVTSQATARILEVNAAMERFFGYSRAEWLGRTSMELGIWPDPAMRERVVRQLERHGSVHDWEIHFRTKSGADAFAQYSAEVIEINGERCMLSVLVDITARKQAEEELRRVNRALRTISNCNQVLVRAAEEPVLLHDVCRVIVEDGGHRLAWVGFIRHDGSKVVQVAAHVGDDGDRLAGAALAWDDAGTGRGPTGAALRTGRPAVCHDLSNDPAMQPWREIIGGRGCQSLVALPLLEAGVVFGVLSIFSADANAFDDQEIRLLVELADDLAYGIQALRARRKHEHAEVEVHRLLGEAERSRSALLSILEDQKQIEEALRNSEERFRSAMQHSPIGMGLMTTDGRWLEANPVLCGIVGYSREELLMRDFQSMTHPDDLDRDRDQLKRFLAREIEACELEKRYLHKDGHAVWIQLNVSVVWNPDGSARHFVCQVQDITERKRAQQALLELNRRYARHEAALSTLNRSYALKPEDLTAVLRNLVEVVARTLDVSRVSIWTYNSARSAIVCLELFERVEDRHTHGMELPRAGHEEYFAAVDSSEVIAATDAMNDPRTATLTTDYLGRIGIASMLDVPLHARGRTTGVLCCEHIGPARAWAPDEQTFAVAVANLVSMLFAQLEQQQLEAQLRQTQKLEALGTLAGGIAHDFNNILGAIISFTELTRMDHPRDAELQENLGEVLKASHRAAGLVRQILAFSRQQKQERHRIQLLPVVREALKLIRSTVPSTIEIQADMPERLPLVLADATQIHQVVMNLCTNACHAMRERPGRLRVALEHLPEPAGPNQGLGVVQLIVTDTGHGMDAATLNRIFDPFFTTKGPGEGTGLGLAVVHGIIKEHDGVIEVASEPGAGTTFRMRLPAVAAEAATTITQQRLPVAGPGGRVLFVDDEIALGESARRLLGRHGFNVEIQVRPDEALALFERDPGRFDAVVTDLNMPAMTGIELATRIHRVRPRLPVFVMTGYGGNLTPDMIRSVGLGNIMAKPLDFTALAARLTQAITTGTNRRPA